MTAKSIIGFFAALFVCGALWGQEGERGQEGETSSGDVVFLELTSVQVKEKTVKVDGKKVKRWVIHVVGKANRLPAGTQVEIMLRWRRLTISRFPLTINQSRRFNEKFTCDFDGYATGLYLRSHIAYDNQSDAVRTAMDNKPEEFWVDASPWETAYMDKTFDLLNDAKDLEKQDVEVQEWFKVRLQRLIDIDKSMNSAKKKAMDKSDFVVGGELDTKLWEKFITKDVREPIKKIQDEIVEQKNGVRFLTHQRDLEVYFSDITNGVARRSVERSTEVYKAFNLPPADFDVYPTVNTNTRGRPKNKWLSQRIRQLCESQEIEGILPDKKKKAASR